MDEGGHGAHVAGAIGSPLNQIGIAASPPMSGSSTSAPARVGFFFLQPTVDALAFAGDRGIDVVKMSFFADPGCQVHVQSRGLVAEQARPRTVIAATSARFASRAVTGLRWSRRWATSRPSSATPRTTRRPGLRAGSERARTMDDSCCHPREGEGVVGVSAVGPSGRRAWYSDFGVEQADGSALAATRSSFRAPRPTRSPRTASSARRARCLWSSAASSTPRTPRIACAAKSSTARPGTGSTTTARRWPRRTRPASPRSSCRAGEGPTPSTAGAH